jgi:tetratricopeptide (TPR) repeat protein
MLKRNVRIIEVALYCFCISYKAFSQSGPALPVPEFFGIYAVTDGRLVKLDGKEVRTERTAQVRMGQRQSVGGVLNGAPVASSQIVNVPVFSPDVKVIVFIQSGGMISPLQVAEPLRVEPLAFVRNLSVDTGPPNNARRNGPENGWEYGNAPELLGLATGDHPESLELLKKPFPGQNDMVVAGFADKLQPGVYRFTLQSGSGLPGLNDASYFTFAVEPIAQAEASKCVDASVTYAMMVSNVKYRPCGAGVRPPSSGEPGTPAAAAGCANFQTCMSAGHSAMRSSSWQEALGAYQAAAPKMPQSGVPWLYIGKAYLGLGRNDDFHAAWDKALQLAHSLSIDACHERALQPCERGILLLSPTEVSFTVLAGRQKIFAAAPTEVAVQRQTTHAAQGHVSLTLEVNRKKYQLDFLPAGIQCETNVFVSCQADGQAQQAAIGNYVSLTLPKLSSSQ